MLFKIVFKASGFNIPFEVDQKIGGFFAAALAEADNVDAAINTAYEKLIACEGYVQLCESSPAPLTNVTIEVDTIYELHEAEFGEQEVSGFIFFPPQEDGDDGDETPQTLQ